MFCSRRFCSEWVGVRDSLSLGQMTLQSLGLTVQHVAPIHMPPLKQIRHTHTHRFFFTQSDIPTAHSLHTLPAGAHIYHILSDSVVSYFLLSWGLEVVFTVALAAPATLHYSHLPYLYRKVQVPPGHSDSSEFFTKSTTPHALHSRCSTLSSFHHLQLLESGKPVNLLSHYWQRDKKVFFFLLLLTEANGSPPGGWFFNQLC